MRGLLTPGGEYGYDDATFRAETQPVVAPPEVSPIPSSPTATPPAALAVPIAPFVQTTSGEAPRSGGQLSLEEQRDLIDRLSWFRQFDPPRFSGRNLEPWEAETWVVVMERLFEYLFVPERYQVHLATNFLESDAETWWRRVRPIGSPGAQLLA